MPDFIADWVTLSGAFPPTEDWEDSRTNPVVGRPHRHRVGIVGEVMGVVAVVGGVLAPLDTALGGRLFTVAGVEYPQGASPPFFAPNVTGRSSVQYWTLGSVPGHYAVQMRRPEGGSVILHLTVRSP